MADLISREAVITALTSEKGAEVLDYSTYTRLQLIELFEAISSVDAVEVVRCRDCKHWWKDAELCVHPKCCEGCVAVVDAPPTHYCGYGERKEDNATD